MKNERQIAQHVASGYEFDCTFISVLALLSGVHEVVITDLESVQHKVVPFSVAQSLTALLMAHSGNDNRHLIPVSYKPSRSKSPLCAHFP